MAENKDEETFEEKPQKVEVVIKKEEKNPDEEVENLKAELEDRNLKLQLVAEKEIEKKLDSLGIHDPELRKSLKENPSRIVGYEAAYRQYRPEKNETPSGSAPLSPQQYGNVPIGYGSVESMVKDLRAKAKSGDSEAQTILDKLWRKTVQGMKERRTIDLPFPTSPEPIGDSTNVKEISVPINLPEDQNQESELEKFGVRRGKRRSEN